MSTIRRVSTFSLPFVTGLALFVTVLTAAGPAPPDDSRVSEDARAHFDRAMALVDAFGDDSSAFLGVRLEEETDDPEGGARVTHVVEESPAADAGLREGDIVQAFDGDVVRGPMALTEKIHAREPGERVTLAVKRDGSTVKLEVELGARPPRMAPLMLEQLDDLRFPAPLPAPDAPAVPHLFEHDPEKDRSPMLRFFPHRSARPRLGVQLVETTPDLREHLGGRRDAGVLVSKILTGTPAEHAGIRVGDLILAVDGVPVATPAELSLAVSSLSGPRPIDIVRDGEPLTIEVVFPDPSADEPATGPRASTWPRPAPAAPLARSI